jgi:diguanylate cyclase (GGDEF)-like protein
LSHEEKIVPLPEWAAPEHGRASARRRRAEDRVLNLLLAQQEEAEAEAAAVAAERCALEVAGFEVVVPREAEALLPSPTPRSPASAHEAVFILDTGTPDAVLLAGAEIRRIPRGAGGAELLGRAAAGAAVWRRERLRANRRLKLPEQLIAYADRLNRAHTPLDVCEALTEHAPGIVGGYTAVVLRREPDEDVLRAVPSPHLPHDVRGVAVAPLARFTRAGLIVASEARLDTGGPFAGLAPLFSETRAVALAHAPFGDDGMVLITERRRDRIFEAEDWDLLRTIARQAAAALERVRLFDEVRDLSLTDPLTGLANRRRMEIVLGHALAAARRGEPLTVIMIDLDGFKSINDHHGHLVGDRVLRTLADYLRQEARGSDLVVRYGGDEFLVVLPGGTAAAAHTLLERVRARLDETTRFSAGVAEYTPSMGSVSELIAAADHDLYARRGRNGGHTPPPEPAAPAAAPAPPAEPAEPPPAPPTPRPAGPLSGLMLPPL